MAIPESFLQELVEKNDIVDVVGEYVRLTKRSGSNQFGLCPFHSEKTPSFSVSPDRQIYHCFGCGKGGGVINFIMEIENLSFPEAVEFLAKRVGMTMPEQEDNREAKKRRRLLDLNRDAARFFYSCLSKPEGKPALDYMARRQITPHTAKRFGLGYAPDTWDSLINAMKALGYSEYEMFDAGLVRKGKNGGHYDTFRNRLMFPVIDVRGDFIGFSGRILGDGEPKYMNSPETMVFNKSRNLFALNLAKKSKSGHIILAEGNVDVVMMHQAGFDGAVASLGTSLTPEQARNHPDKNIITRAVGTQDTVKIDFFDIQLEEGNQLVMCSDGLSNMVTDEEILIVGADSSTDMTCCPFCGSANIGKRNTPGMAMVILYFLLSALFPIFRSANKCFDCGKIWKFKKIRQ